MQIFRRSDGNWYRWDGLAWSGPFATAEEALYGR